MYARKDISIHIDRAVSFRVLIAGPFSQEKEAAGAFPDMAVMQWSDAAQSSQELQEFLAWQQDLDSDAKSPTQARPTVFRWSGAAKEVYVSGSFNNWSTKIPLNRR